MINSHSQPGLGGASCQPGVCGIIPGCFSYCSTALWTLTIVNIRATFQTPFFFLMYWLRDYGNKYLPAHSEWAGDASSGSVVVIGGWKLPHVQGNNTLQCSGNIVFVLLILFHQNLRTRLALFRWCNNGTRGNAEKGKCRPRDFVACLEHVGASAVNRSKTSS